MTPFTREGGVTREKVKVKSGKLQLLVVLGGIETTPIGFQMKVSSETVIS